MLTEKQTYHKHISHQFPGAPTPTSKREYYLPFQCNHLPPPAKGDHSSWRLVAHIVLNFLRVESHQSLPPLNSVVWGPSILFHVVPDCSFPLPCGFPCSECISVGPLCCCWSFGWYLVWNYNGYRSCEHSRTCLLVNIHAYFCWANTYNRNH